MVEFKVYERTETLTAVGKVAQLVGKGGSIGLIPKNFKDLSKRIVVILKKADGTSAQVTCSKQVSDGIRDKSIEMGHLLNFEVLENEAGVPYISLPSSGQLFEVQVNKLQAKAFVPKAVDYEQLIAL